MKPRVFLSILTLAMLGVPQSARAVAPTQGELAAAKAWVQNNLIADHVRKPFSFVYGGKPSCDRLNDWKLTKETRELDPQRREHTLRWMDVATGLQVRCTAVEYADFPVVEWTVHLKNTGSDKTPVLEGIQGLDGRFERKAEGAFVLHGIRGDSCVAESYRPYAFTLGAGTVKKFSPPSAPEVVSGKSSDGRDGWPYFNLQKPGGGVIVAVGWPGQWEASFTRDHDHAVQIMAGQQLTHLYLKPGEEIRTPLIALLFWQGADVVRAQNIWRSWYMAHNLPT